MTRQRNHAPSSLQRRLVARAGLALGLAAGLCPLAGAQERYPSRPIEMIVPWGPGGGADVLGRIVGRWLETDLKTPVPVSNLAGASGMIGLGRLAQLPADGHALAVLTGDSLMMAASPAPTFRIAETTALAVLVRQPSGLFLPPGGRYKSWDDVVKALQAKPGSVTVAITGPNTADDLTVRYLASRGLSLVGVPYTKPGERYAAVVGGHVDLLYEQAGDLRGFLDAGQLKPILFFAEQRLAAPFADVPVSRELGYEILLPQVRALLVRSGTDTQRLQALSRSIERFVASPEYRQFIEQQLALPDSFLPLARAQPFLQSELEVSRKLLATYGVK
ncbi:tripartite tricarboxylate transporter substrate binding protein [Piscinibacter sakaiensis]|uniref:Putative exported protein n=1 Tax=Piscinibacter sakaiensis TaxID=1547922 RepID=A0A0K8P621_PISS1|nr:tripartite tricarboxylate transporter substrate binding protein [Piscinibacter sakaiensis]GAP37979.1 putative exported protein [Piscinibacter sakaiensis]